MAQKKKKQSTLKDASQPRGYNPLEPQKTNKGVNNNNQNITPDAQAEQDARNKAGLQPQTWYVGNNQVSKKEYDILTGRRGGMLTPAIENIRAQQVGTPEYQQQKANTLQEFYAQNEAQQQALKNRFINNTPRGDFTNRTAQAGVSFLQQMAINPLANALGIPAKNLADATINKKGIIGTITKIPAVALGALATGIGPANPSQVLGLGKDIPNIEGDLRDIESNQEKVLREARATGNYAGANDALEALTQAAYARADELQVAVANSPSDIRDGKTVGDTIYRRINSLESTRRIIQYTIQTGDTSQLDSYLLSLNASQNGSQ